MCWAEHPVILECAVFGLKTTSAVIHRGHYGMPIRNPAELLATYRVARFKIPKFFHQIEELPETVL